jgi:hypothetical protein
MFPFTTNGFQKKNSIKEHTLNFTLWINLPFYTKPFAHGMQTLPMWVIIFKCCHMIVSKSFVHFFAS